LQTHNDQHPRTGALQAFVDTSSVDKRNDDHQIALQHIAVSVSSGKLSSFPLSICGRSVAYRFMVLTVINDKEQLCPRSLGISLVEMHGRKGTSLSW
jgi:hypothetical protein